MKLIDKQKIQLELLEDLLEQFKGVNCEYHSEIVQDEINQIKNK